MLVILFVQTGVFQAELHLLDILRDPTFSKDPPFSHVFSSPHHTAAVLSGQWV